MCYVLSRNLFLCCQESHVFIWVWVGYDNPPACCQQPELRSVCICGVSAPSHYTLSVMCLSLYWLSCQSPRVQSLSAGKASDGAEAVHVLACESKSCCGAPPCDWLTQILPVIFILLFKYNKWNKCNILFISSIHKWPNIYNRMHATVLFANRSVHVHTILKTLHHHHPHCDLCCCFCLQTRLFAAGYNVSVLIKPTLWNSCVCGHHVCFAAGDFGYSVYFEHSFFPEGVCLCECVHDHRCWIWLPSA